ncbi:hypothetical protein GRI97_12185 [Altererythrobacter xixiisoli]|uniref:Lipoprotein n=1 Tax=Croceibacterium xixiisoli TaxID=1476466 RepID=A0A6I4TY78_9SPHN|nr:hypothetical protein [Croceibacterium xixiisoli]MXO99747.1 hypothetical protein [Croceibacterium xixiisoli]
MKKAALLILLASAGCGVGNNDGKESCERGSLTQQELAGTLIKLQDSNIKKIDEMFQGVVDDHANGRDSFEATLDMRSRFELKDVEGYEWHAVKVFGFFGENREDSLNYYDLYSNIIIYYFPESKNAVISTATPHSNAVTPSSFWSFVNLPEDMQKVSFECARFE